MTLVVAVFITGALWALLPYATRLVNSIGIPKVVALVVRMVVLQVIEWLSRRFWLSPELRMYDWRSSDAWKWVVTTLASNNVSLGVEYLVASGLTWLLYFWRKLTSGGYW